MLQGRGIGLGCRLITEDGLIEVEPERNCLYAVIKTFSSFQAAGQEVMF